MSCIPTIVVPAIILHHPLSSRTVPRQDPRANVYNLSRKANGKRVERKTQPYSIC
jgi:hypothetical protein